jgi:hypothetical protein
MMKFESIEFTQGFMQINTSRPLINKRQLGVKRLTEALLIGINENDKVEQLLAKLSYAAEATTHDYSRLDKSLCTANERTQDLHDTTARERGKSSGGGSSRHIYWLSGSSRHGKVDDRASYSPHMPRRWPPRYQLFRLARRRRA